MAALVYRDLPWGKIRREWENTGTTLAALARKHGIRSTTTLERKRVAEQWSRVLTIEGDLAPSAAEDRLDAGQVGCLPDPRAPNPSLTQAELAVEMQMTGLLLLRRLQGVLQPPSDDEAAEAVMLGNLQRLIRVNPERETLAGLLAAACKTVEMGLAIERRALADAANKPPPEAAPWKSGAELLKGMDVETALKLRACAVKIQNEKRQAEIDAAAKSGK